MCVSSEPGFAGLAAAHRAGRIYRAGSERATAMHGLMEGAVRSGEQAADDVVTKIGKTG